MIRRSDECALKSWEMVNPFSIQYSQVGAGRSSLHDPDLLGILKGIASRLLSMLRNWRKHMERVAATGNPNVREKERDHVKDPVRS